MTNRIKAILTALLILSAMCATAAADHPATWDWRDVNGTNYMTPPKFMGGCGGCWAYAAISVVEAKIMINHGIETDLSEQYFLSECFSGGDCSGGYPNDVLAMIQYSGVMSEECVPRTSNMSCYTCDYWQEDAWSIDRRVKIYSPTTSKIKSSIMTYGPVTATVKPNHAAVLAGWNDSLNGGSWIVKDCIGPGELNDGYMDVQYSNVSEVYYVGNTYQPTPCERYDTNYDLEIQFDEVMAAMQDFFNDIITIDTYNEVHACYVACNPCEAYDTNNDDIIQFDEMMAAMQDYFNDIISIDTFNAVLDCYNA